MKKFITLIPYSKTSFIAGFLTFLAAIVGFLVIGGIYTDTQARGLVDAMTPSVRTLCFAVITSASTIIPLMLAMLGLAGRVDQEFDEIFYQRVKIIAMLGAAALISATLLLLFVSFPITETESLLSWFRAVYVIVVAGSAWIASLLVAMVITLYSALMGIMRILTPSFDTHDSRP